MLLVLGGFVLVIGPLDWLVLGRFRLRRLTWIVFPLAALAFTALTVFLAGRFMGKSNHRSSVTITDSGHDGHVLRETRIEMIFPARAQEVATEMRNALCVPMSVQGRYGNSTAAVQGRYEGLFPVSYTLRQSLAQWTPQMNRLTSLEAGRDDSGLDWAKLHPADLSAEIVGERFGSDRSWEIYKLHQGELTAFRDDVRPRERMRGLCQPKPSGWLTVCSQSSPNGAGDLEDLPLAGIGDKEVSATIVVRKEGAITHIYRHLFTP